jgi:hypothetical protein
VRRLPRSPREPTNPHSPSHHRAIVPIAGSPPLNDPRWIYEPKFDGFRGMLYVSGRECYIRSKRGKVLSRFADLAFRVGAELHAQDAILDGEVVALDDEGRMDFRALLVSRGSLHYAAFDLPWLNGRDLRGQPLIKRKRRLEQLIPANNSTLSRVLAVEAGFSLPPAVDRRVGAGVRRVSGRPGELVAPGPGHRPCDWRPRAGCPISWSVRPVTAHSLPGRRIGVGAAYGGPSRRG